MICPLMCSNYYLLSLSVKNVHCPNRGSQNLADLVLNECSELYSLILCATKI